jgi:hypothetical protein
MAKKVIERIRQQVIEHCYDISNHALEEAADDEFDIFDIETALLTGEIIRKYHNDPRGTRYVILGIASNHERHITVVGRFRGDQIFRIITVYDPDKER